MKKRIVLFAALVCFFDVELFAQKDISLKDAFKDDFLIGSAINESQVSGKDSISSAIVKKQFNTITAENILKWERIHPERDKFNFEPADRYTEYGKQNKMFIIGHTLIWHSQTPAWVFKNDEGNLVDKETLLKRIQEHIQKVVGHYKGVINGWDVVNEALDEDGSLRQSLWMKIIGEEYITKAFQFAHEADPDVQLYYNDYSLENKAKREGAISLIKKLQSQGIKIDGVGLQGHYKMDWPSPAQIDSAVKDFAALGLKVMITELDVDVLPYQNITADVSSKINIDKALQQKFNPYKDSLPDSAQSALAERYKDLFSVFVNNKESISRITFWGVTDKESWLNFWPIWGRSNYPLLFDRNGHPKPAFYSVIKTGESNYLSK